MGAEAFVVAQIVDFTEATDDRVASLLVAGSGISIAYNDGAGTLTIANTGLGGSTGSTDNRILRADGTGGSTVQNSAVTIDDSGNISGLGTVGCGAITTSGEIIFSDISGGNIRWTGGSRIFCGVNGRIALYQSNLADFGLLQLGGTSASFPALKRNGAALEARLANDSGVAAFICGAITASGNVSVTGWIDASSIRCDGSQVFDTSGSRIDVGRSGGFQIATMPGTLQLGNTDAFAPAIKRKAVDVPVAQIRLANDSGFADLELASLIASGLVTAGVYTVATLPSAAANAGALAQVTDSSVTTNGSAVSGSGSNRVVVFSNGSTWDVVVA